MSDALLNSLRDAIQKDIGHRGLCTDPKDNLLTETAADFAAACRDLAKLPELAVAVVTGFLIPHAQPPCHETDGPLGAVYLARALVPINIPVTLVTDKGQTRALDEGLKQCGLNGHAGVRVLSLPGRSASKKEWERFCWQMCSESHRPPPCLVALERPGPSHALFSLRRQAQLTPETLAAFEREVPADHRNQCHTMRGQIISSQMSPVHKLFEQARAARPPVPTIGIGDGGNEMGMGKIRWETLRRNIPNGGLVACRVPTDYLIVCGVSNWGAYALATGVRLLRGAAFDPTLFEPEVELRILEVMVERGPLADGVTGQPTVTVDGLPFESYVQPLIQLGQIASRMGT